MKILFLDIETAPNVAHVWGLFKQNIGINQILDSGYTMCWAAKFLGEEGTYFDSIQLSGEKNMLDGIHALLEEADVAVHWNGNKFDIPTLNKEFVLNGMAPPAPAKNLDLMLVSRNRFRFASNKLDYVAQQLGVGKKIEHEGHNLWIRCMNGEQKAWREMEEYNIHDVALLEGVYHKFLPWIKNHPNLNIDNATGVACPNCGGHHLERRGFTSTVSSKFQRYQCKDCGTWSRGKVNIANKKIIVQDKT